MNNRLILFLLALVWLGCVGCNTNEYSDASELLRKEPKIIQDALNGKADAQRRLALFYMQGSNGCKQNYKKAFKFAQMAAANNNSSGRKTLALLYFKGWGTPINYKKAKEYLELTERESYHSRTLLGYMYYKGLGVERDAKKALEKFDSSGDDCAYFMAGNILWNGDGIEKDPEGALNRWKEGVLLDNNDKCSTIPLDEGFKEFEINVQEAVRANYAQAKYIWAEYNKSDTDVEKVNSVELYTQAADADNGEAQFALADRYYFGKDIEKDYDKAFKYFELAYLQEEPIDCSNIALGNMYFNGKGVKRDIAKAKKLWNEPDLCDSKESTYVYSIEAFNNIKSLVLENKDVKEALRQADQCYDEYTCFHQHDSWGNKHDLYCTQSAIWYEIAANMGSAKAAYVLGRIYHDNYNLSCGYEMPNEHDPIEAEKWFLKAAQLGDKEAMFRLGDMYFYGDSFYDYPKQDSRKAEKWFLKAAKLGQPYAELFLTRLYYGDNSGIIPDYQKVLYWGNKAVKAGVDEANYYLGLLYYYGKGVKKDYKKAFELFADIEHGSFEKSLANQKIREMFLLGRGVHKNIEKAKGIDDFICFTCDNSILATSEDYQNASATKLWQEAIEQDNLQAQYWLAKRLSETENPNNSKILDRAFEFYSRVLLHTNVKTAIERELQEKAKEYFDRTLKDLNIRNIKIENYKTTDIETLRELALFRSDTRASLELGMRYMYKVIDADDRCSSEAGDEAEHAAEWLNRAAVQGDPNAQLFLFYIYKDFTCTPNIEFPSVYRLPKAQHWLELSAAQGNSLAQYELATEYYNAVYFDDSGVGRGWRWREVYIARDLKKAFELYSKSAEQGNAKSMYMLGNMYANGEYVGKNFQKSKEWYEKAIKNGNKDSVREIGNLFTDKEFAEFDISKALEAYEKAANNNDIDAQIILGKMYENGELVPQSFEMAKKWYLKAIENGNYNAKIALSKLYENPNFPEQDKEKAKQILDQANDVEFRKVMNRMGVTNEQLDAFKDK